MIKWLTVALIITWIFLIQTLSFLISRYGVIMNAHDWLDWNSFLLFMYDLVIIIIIVVVHCGVDGDDSMSSNASNILTASINYVHMVSASVLSVNVDLAVL